MAARRWCSWIERAGVLTSCFDALFLRELSVNGILRRRRGFCLLATLCGGHQALSFPLLHELVVFRRAGPGRGVRGHAANPCRDGVADAAREFFVDGAASAQAKARERERDECGDMAGPGTRRAPGVILNSKESGFVC